MTVGDLLRHAENRISSRSEAEWILVSKLSFDSRVDLFSRVHERVGDTQATAIEKILDQREKGQPLQYLLEEAVFLERTYAVGPGVLIPRPETEVLVSTAIESLEQPELGLEIGFGSGVISVELLKAFPSLRMVSSEVSEVAMGWGSKNFKRHSVDDRVQQVRAPSFLDVLPFSDVRADFLVSNPPYLACESEAQEQVAQHEPHEALFSKKDPLYFYKVIAERASQCLKDEGRVFLELPHERAGEVERLFQIGWKEKKIIQDLTGRPRVLVASQGEREHG